MAAVVAVGGAVGGVGAVVAAVVAAVGGVDAAVGIVVAVGGGVAAAVAAAAAAVAVVAAVVAAVGGVRAAVAAAVDAAVVAVGIVAAIVDVVAAAAVLFWSVSLHVLGSCWMQFVMLSLLLPPLLPLFLLRLLQQRSCCPANIAPAAGLWPNSWPNMKPIKKQTKSIKWSQMTAATSGRWGTTSAPAMCDFLSLWWR